MSRGVFAALHAELVEATRLRFDACRRAHPGETFYAFALVTPLEPWCHTEETIERQRDQRTKRAAAPESSEMAGFRRYCPDEWWPTDGEPIRTARGRTWGDLTADLARAALPYMESDPDVVRELMVDIMAALDDAGYWGRGADRERVTLMIYLSDNPASRFWWPESVRRLNPPGVTERFFAAVPSCRGE